VLLTSTEPGIVPEDYLETADIYTVMNGRVTQDAIASTGTSPSSGSSSSAESDD